MTVRPSLPSDLSDSRVVGSFLREVIKTSGKRIKDVAEAAGISDPSYLSHILAGRVNFAESDYFLPLADVLALSTDEIKRLKPSLFVTAVPVQETSQRASAWTVDIPNELLEAADRWGNIESNRLLRNPRVQQMLAQGMSFGQEPETAEDWYDYFRSVKKYIRVDD